MSSSIHTAQAEIATSDPGVDMSLHGTQLIQASAGTGKTFTLATLVTRLVIERGLSMAQILVVTYTEAATQELRERLRERLQRAVQIAQTLSTGVASEAVPSYSKAGDAITALLIERQLQSESPPALHARLQRAAQEIDLAAVHTIHGFCARTLSEHALEGGRGLTPLEMIGSEKPLLAELAIDLWRSLGADDQHAQALQRRWKQPSGLERDLAALLKADPLLPAMSVAGSDPSPALASAAIALRAALLECAASARADMAAAMHQKVLSGNKYQVRTVDSVWDALHRWVQVGASSTFAHEKLELLGNRKLATSANKGRDAELPCSELFTQVDAYLDARDAVDAFIERGEIALVHHVRTLGQQRLAAMKQRQQVQSFDDLINDLHAALDGEHAEPLIKALRTRYTVALVDEFQDTDARQWSIFRRVFGSDDVHAGVDPASTRALFLIGDPKQAIYRFRGGDVHTYLDAAATVKADNRHALRRNFRSRPLLLEAVNALYANAGESAFSEPGIDYEPVAAGGSITDDSYQRDGRNAPALTLRVLPTPEHGGPAFNAETSREHAARSCAVEIHTLLTESRADSARIDDRVLRPGDLAVLVARHADAARMQRVLAECGIASVAAGRHSVLHGTVAQEIIWLLEALLRPADPSRMRAALASVLLGLDAAAIVRLEHDSEWKSQHALELQAWGERWRRYGPLALLEAVCAANVPRLLTLSDGERRLTDALQIAELLQEAVAHTTGLQGQLDWLQAQIADADREDEARQLRLESDADRVQIVTLHKSKGLQYPLVFLPFVGIGQSAKSSNVLDYYHDGRRVTQLQSARVIGEELAWKAAKLEATKQFEAESMRLLYVGLTRARHSLWIATGALYSNEKSALEKLPGARANAIDPAMIASGAIVIDNAPLPGYLPKPLPALPALSRPVVRVAQRALRRDWWVYSFSQLARSPAQAFAVAVADADATVASASIAQGGSAADELHAANHQAAEPQSGFGGARFGSALHEALENIVFERWLDWRDPFPPPDDAEALRAALRTQGYVDADVELALPLLTTLVRETLNVRLPEGARLAAIRGSDRLAEMEFYFHMEPTSVEAVITLLHTHGLILQRQAFGLRGRIEGLMTGKIDLVYAFEGKLHVLDYKSNRLPDYSADTLTAAMRDSEYDLQYLIYTLALHRWLRFRRGDAYDYDRDIGGVRYLFCRGLDAASPTSPGIFACKPPRALIETLDALFASDTLAREVTT